MRSQGTRSRRWSASSKREWLAEVDWAGGDAFLGTDLAGHGVVYDAGDGVPRGISPMRALLTSLGACSGMDVVAILRKRKQKVTSVKIMLTGERPEYGYPKPWQSIDMKYIISGEGLEQRFVSEAVEESMAKFCSVAATLRPGVKITYSYETS